MISIFPTKVLQINTFFLSICLYGLGIWSGESLKLSTCIRLGGTSCFPELGKQPILQSSEGVGVGSDIHLIYKPFNRWKTPTKVKGHHFYISIQGDKVNSFWGDSLVAFKDRSTFRPRTLVSVYWRFSPPSDAGLLIWDFVTKMGS